jgi:hypothetical protein
VLLNLMASVLCRTRLRLSYANAPTCTAYVGPTPKCCIHVKERI